MAGLPSWAKRPELCGQRKHSTSVYASPEIVKPVSSQTSYATHFPARPLPDDPRFVQDSSYVTARHEGSPISCTVRLDGPPVAHLALPFHLSHPFSLSISLNFAQKFDH
eukprot:m.58291 g.58291  ORF g.58291 m.58291 type:complete len:109 (+) comp12164_c0_seq6:54-380(+)